VRPSPGAASSAPLNEVENAKSLVLVNLAASETGALRLLSAWLAVARAGGAL